MERVLCPILIGREEELSRLEDALLSANRGEGQVVLLAGDAGISCGALSRLGRVQLGGSEIGAGSSTSGDQHPTVQQQSR
jgi:hypothetical protein